MKKGFIRVGLNGRTKTQKQVGSLEAEGKHASEMGSEGAHKRGGTRRTKRNLDAEKFKEDVGNFGYFIFKVTASQNMMVEEVAQLVAKEIKVDAKNLVFIRDWVGQDGMRGYMVAVVGKTTEDSINSLREFEQTIMEEGGKVWLQAGISGYEIGFISRYYPAITKEEERLTAVLQNSRGMTYIQVENGLREANIYSEDRFKNLKLGENGLFTVCAASLELEAVNNGFGFFWGNRWIKVGKCGAGRFFGQAGTKEPTRASWAAKKEVEDRVSGTAKEAEKSKASKSISEILKRGQESNGVEKKNAISEKKASTQPAKKENVGNNLNQGTVKSVEKKQAVKTGTTSAKSGQRWVPKEVRMVTEVELEAKVQSLEDQLKVQVAKADKQDARAAEQETRVDRAEAEVAELKRLLLASPEELETARAKTRKEEEERRIAAEKERIAKQEQEREVQEKKRLKEREDQERESMARKEQEEKAAWLRKKQEEKAAWLQKRLEDGRAKNELNKLNKRSKPDTEVVEKEQEVEKEDDGDECDMQVESPQANTEDSSPDTTSPDRKATPKKKAKAGRTEKAEGDEEKKGLLFPMFGGLEEVAKEEGSTGEHVAARNREVSVKAEEKIRRAEEARTAKEADRVKKQMETDEREKVKRQVEERALKGKEEAEEKLANKVKVAREREAREREKMEYEAKFGPLKPGELFTDLAARVFNYCRVQVKMGMRSRAALLIRATEKTNMVIVLEAEENLLEWGGFMVVEENSQGEPLLLAFYFDIIAGVEYSTELDSGKIAKIQMEGGPIAELMRTAKATQEERDFLATWTTVVAEANSIVSCK